MKLLRFVLSSVLLMGGIISPGQSNRGDLVADIPFAFVVAKTTLVPGHYVVSTLGENIGIRDRQNRGAFVPAHAQERPAQENSSMLVFHRYGDVYFLAEMWVSGNSIGRALFPSRAERRLEEIGKEREIAVVRMGR